MIRRLLLSAVASGVVLGAGCRHKCCRTDTIGPAPAPFLPSGPNNIPPPGVPVTPVTPVLPPAASGSLPPPALGPSSSGRPAPEVLTPDPLPSVGPSSRSSSASPGILGGPVKGPVQTKEPPLAKTNAVLLPPTAGPSAVAGLPGLTKIKDGVTTGRRPTLDGFDGLKRGGYRTVVYLHPAGADVSAVRDMAETRGLSFVAVETTPATLAEALDRVNQTASEKAARPVYVFDDDGQRTGAVWYLHLKTVDLESPEVARIRARGIGLTDDSEFWPAIQKVSASR
jgi:hypothetical protein